MKTLRTLVLASGLWTLAVARANAQGAQASGLRAARSLARGDTLTAADIVADSGSTADPASIVGFVARRMIREGEPLKAPAIGHAIVVKAGTNVTVNATSGGITVSRFGVAMFDAGLGDSVRVRLDSRVSVIGVVRDRATVILP